MNCYINNPKSGARLPSELNMTNTMFYPEKTMTTYERHTSGVPKDFHIVTDAPELVSLYRREEVFMWCPERQRWVNPPINTYGATIEAVRGLFGIHNSIPRAVLDGAITNIMGHPLSPRQQQEVQRKQKG